MEQKQMKQEMLEFINKAWDELVVEGHSPRGFYYVAVGSGDGSKESPIVTAIAEGGTKPREVLTTVLKHIRENRGTATAVAVLIEAIRAALPEVGVAGGTAQELRGFFTQQADKKTSEPKFPPQFPSDILGKGDK